MKIYNKQRGLSLIELMIAMMVSLVLVAGVGTVYLSSKRNYQTRDQLSMMDENARVALNALSKHLEHAGYATPSKLPLESIGGYFYVNGDPDPVAGGCGTVQARALTALKQSSTQDALNRYGDAVSIRFIGDQTLFTDVLSGVLPSACFEGSPSLQDSLIYNAFHVDDDGASRDSAGSLIPILYGVGSNTNQYKRPIVNGIENIQFMYGVDVNADGAVDKYVNATNVGAGEWQRIISIKVGLLVRSIDPVLPAPEAHSYQVLDVTQTLNDRYQRSVYTAVIHLRNVVSN
ncbi:PilW family protein [Candidatus Thiothrix sp. Deng01]|uniref:PilW family protein n=1 Tax=Candidatus Thiothrix phosphatis TaxID=3112415 RepID=A0ABU6D0P7_9GAMM|nr:PilW family protein [Candidatus Thiothrix sp. Deng01]MEB4592382.1 PilW family protein [Candidatus Thiothrix sp. Deng01]